MNRAIVSLAALVGVAVLAGGCGSSQHATTLPGLTPAKLAKLTAVVREEALQNGSRHLYGGTVYATTEHGANRAAAMGDDVPDQRVYLVVFPGFVCMVDRATLRVLEIAVGSAHVDTSKLGPGVPISLGSHWFDYALVALVVLLFGAFVLARRRFGFGGGGPRVAPSILILVAAGVVAAVAWPTLRTWGFCGDEVHGGANIDHAVVLALLCAVLGSVALRALRPDSRYVAAGLLVAAVLLSVCLALVAVDSAAYAVHNSGGGGGDMFNCPYDAETSIHRVWYLYPAWGSAVALLLLQAVRAFRYVRRPTDSGTESGEADGE